MSPRIFSCILCGFRVYEDQGAFDMSWRNEFRAIYSSPSGPAVSGVGLYNDPNSGEFIAPLECSVRWDDDDHDSPKMDVIGMMRQGPVHGRHGYIIHEACWCLLGKAYYPKPIPYRRLLEVCQSLPSPLNTNGINWGHDFGGLVPFNDQLRYPWEDRFADRNEEIWLSATADPYSILEIRHLLQETPQSPPLGQTGSIVSRQLQTQHDYFFRLPQETCILTATFLPTSDFLNLRHASRAFASVFFVQQFWRSRFKQGSDRCWLFELHESHELLDWRWIYRRTNAAHETPALRNRRRIWNLIQPLKDVLASRVDNLFPLPSLNLNRENLHWTEVSAYVNEEHHRIYESFKRGCRLFHRQQAPIPKLPFRITFFFVQVGYVEYLAGIQLISQNGKIISLGYLSEKEGISMDVCTLQGFNLAVGSKGIQAIQYITEDGCTSEWAGSPNESPRTQRLAVYCPILALAVGFDGCKIVSLAIVEDNACCTGTEMLVRKPRSIRFTSLWYPEIPGPDLDLNDESFTMKDDVAVGYEPLCWSLFGGMQGVYLRNLTAISVVELGSIRSIEFHYDRDDIPIQCRKLGRPVSLESANTFLFPINGPGGEVINGVEVSLLSHSGDHLSRYYQHGIVQALKVSTNLGRSYHFPPQEYNAGDFVVKSLAISPGSTITGVYIRQDPEQPIVGLGVISEAI